MKLTNQYNNLDSRLCQASQPYMVSDPRLLLWNTSLANQLGLNQLDKDKRADYMSGQLNLPGSNPVACAYAGHQFAHFNPQLGDGRAHLLGEISNQEGVYELQLKGSGQTPYSRNGDGLCTLAPALREYMMSEAMHYLGVPTTRCLAVVSTGDSVMRETALPGAIVTRVAKSHVRVGTFEYFAARGQMDVVKKLADFVIQRHYPDINDNKNPYLSLLSRVIEQQINLINHWLRVGFIHGVMNTDNTLLSGETIDFGPCAMLGVYHQSTVYSSIDRRGRYAFGEQSHIMQWNMARLAECLLPLFDEDDTLALHKAEDLIKIIPGHQKDAFVAMMNRKLGFQSQQFNHQWLTDFLLRLQDQQLDYTTTFTAMTAAVNEPTNQAELENQLGDFYQQWQQKVVAGDLNNIKQTMQENNPLVIPRNHDVEKVLSAAVKDHDLEPYKHLLEVLKSPYKLTEDTHQYQQASPDYDAAYQTFCGT